MEITKKYYFCALNAAIMEKYEFLENGRQGHFMAHYGSQLHVNKQTSIWTSEKKYPSKEKSIQI